MPNHSNRNRDETNSNNPRRGAAGVIRSGSHGRMLREPPEPAPNVEGYRKASSGRFVGFDLVDPGMGRSDSGQLTNTDPERQLSRRELQARYGHHNTGERRVSDDVTGATQSPVGMAADAVQSGVDTAVGLGRSVVDTTDSFTSDLPEPGERRPAGGRRGDVEAGFVDNLASGRDADIAFVSAEEDRPSDPADQDLFQTAFDEFGVGEREPLDTQFADSASDIVSRGKTGASNGRGGW